MFDLIGFTYVLRFGDFKDLSRFHHSIVLFLGETIEIEVCFRPTKNNFRFIQITCPSPNIFKKWISEMLGDVKTRFVEMMWEFLVFF